MGKGKKAAREPAAAKGPKKSRIPRPVQSRAFSLFGLLALTPIAWMLLKGRLDLEAAAQRAVIVLIGLMLIERVLAPLVLAVLNSGRKQPPDDGQAPASESPA